MEDATFDSVGWMVGSRLDDTVYGGFFIVLSFLAGWSLDGDRPDLGDVVGGSIALGGVLLILFWRLLFNAMHEAHYGTKWCSRVKIVVASFMLRSFYRKISDQSFREKARSRSPTTF
jgi:chromate transport protein ChrA